MVFDCELVVGSDLQWMLMSVCYNLAGGLDAILLRVVMGWGCLRWYGYMRTVTSHINV